MKEATLTNDERIAMARLHALLELLPTALDKELASVGITSFEYTVLSVLRAADDRRLRLSLLASKTNATLPRLSRVITALEKKGMVRRMPCPADGRATNAVLTSEGERTQSEAEPIYSSAAKRMVLQGLGNEGAQRLAQIAYDILFQLDPDANVHPPSGDPAPAVEAACKADF